jgi:predicted ATP-grasp superfamily ATP-dependent carboligase
VGASARAAAHSARRAGYTVHAADVFADVDLRSSCAFSSRVRKYSDFARVLAGEQPGGWIYTGALENYSRLVERLARKRQLLGNSGAVLRRVRSPWALAASLARGGLPHLEVRRTNDALPLDGTWLRKKLCSAGGADMMYWDQLTAATDISDPEYYYQQYVEGAPCSALFVAARGEARLLGVTRQLIGVHWAGAGGFQYCGSVGPMPISEKSYGQFADLGNLLASEFQLQGLFGVDAVLQGATLWPVEINPRYPASAEVLERALGLSAISLHVAACLDGKLPENGSLPSPDSVATTCGKAILFARRKMVAPACLGDIAHQQSQCPWPQLADLPAEGTLNEPHSPVLTVFASGETETQVLELLKDKLAATQALFETDRT